MLGFSSNVQWSLAAFSVFGVRHYIGCVWAWAGGICRRGSLEAEAGQIPGRVCVFPSFTKNEPHSPASGCVCRGGTRWELGLISLILGWLQSDARSERLLILDLSVLECTSPYWSFPFNTFSTFSVPGEATLGHSMCSFLSERHL